jgi:hypothetical protein
MGRPTAEALRAANVEPGAVSTERTVEASILTLACTIVGKSLEGLV